MDKQDRVIGGLAAFAGFLTVAGGAFGAHGLAGSIPPVDLAAFQTGMRYGQVHAVAALLALLMAKDLGPFSRRAAIAYLTGILLFSGSLAILGLTGSRALVLITPIGGLFFLAGWALLCISFIKQR